MIDLNGCKMQNTQYSMPTTHKNDDRMFVSKMNVQISVDFQCDFGT